MAQEVFSVVPTADIGKVVRDMLLSGQNFRPFVGLYTPLSSLMNVEHL